MNTDGDSELRRSSARKSWDSLSPRYVRVRSAKKSFFVLLRCDFNEICFLCFALLSYYCCCFCLFFFAFVLLCFVFVFLLFPCFYLIYEL